MKKNLDLIKSNYEKEILAIEDNFNEENSIKIELIKKKYTKELLEIIEISKFELNETISTLLKIDPKAYNQNVFTDFFYENLENLVSEEIDSSDYQIEDDYGYDDFLVIAKKVFKKLQEYTKHPMLEIKKHTIDMIISMLYSDEEGPMSIGDEVKNKVQEYLEGMYAIE